MSSNIVELIAGNGINIDINETNDTITLSSISSLTQNQKDALENPDANAANKFVTDSEVKRIVSEESIKLIKLTTVPTLITSSGTYKIPITGKYEIRFCGGGAAGSKTIDDGNSLNGIAFLGGTGGNSGYLKILKSNLNKDETIQIIIGGGGTPPNNNAREGDGGDTKITVNGVTHVANGGKCNHFRRSDAVNDPCNSIFRIEKRYNGLEGSSMGAYGKFVMSGNIGSIPTIYNTSGEYGVIPGGGGDPENHYKKQRFGGGGGGGVIFGNILAEAGGASSPAAGYGAGGGGQHAFDGQSGTILAGKGAQGAVQITYLGNE